MISDIDESMTIYQRGYQLLREEGVRAFTLKSAEYIMRKIRAQSYRFGSKRKCPICGFTGSKFIPMGRRPNALCPKCGAQERHRLLWYYLRNETDLIKDNNNVLYFAPTDEIAKKLRLAGNNVTTIDINMDDDINADITRLPFRDSVFDLIICVHVLEHIPDDQGAISELTRVLVGGGDALIMVPKNKSRGCTHEDQNITSPDARQREFGQSNHVRVYGRDFTTRLSRNGFDVEAVTYARNINSDTVERHGLIIHDRGAFFGPVVSEGSQKKYEDIHHCQKVSE